MMRRHKAPILTLLLLTLLAFARVILPVEGQAIGGLDMGSLFYPWLEFAHNAVWQGKLPLWDATRFAGYPFIANPQLAFFYPPTWLALIFKVNTGVALYLIFHVWLSGVGIYLFVAESDKEKSYDWHVGAFLAALSWMFSGFFAARIFAGHIGLLAVHAWMGWLLLATERALSRRTWQSAVFAGAPFGLAILAGHTTSLIYVGLLWGLYWLYRAGTAANRAASFWKAGSSMAAQLVIAAIIGLLIGSVQLLPLVEFAGLAARSAKTTYDFAARFSFPPSHLVSLINPRHFGDAIVGWTGAENFEELTVYVGVLPIIAVGIAIIRPNRQRLFWLLMALFGVLVGLGSNSFLHPLLYDLVPPFRITRAPARALFLFIFSACTLLGLVVGNRPKYAKLLLPLLTVVILFDLGSFGHKLLRREPIVPSGYWFAAADIIGDHQRVLPWGIPFFEQNEAAQVGVDSIFGYNALEVNNMAQLFAQATDPRAETYDLLGADYVVATTPLNDFAQGQAGDLSLLEERDGLWIYQRPNEQSLVWLEGVTGLSGLSASRGLVDCDYQLGEGGGSAEILARDDGYWQITTASETPQLLVTSETAYPGWQVTIDGASADWFTVYGALRGVCLPAGEHVVEWQFRPKIFLYGGALSLIGIALVGAALKQKPQIVSP